MQPTGTTSTAPTLDTAPTSASAPMLSSRVTLAMNAKGLCQPEVSLAFATPDELETRGVAMLRRIMDELRRQFPTPAGAPDSAPTGAPEANPEANPGAGTASAA